LQGIIETVIEGAIDLGNYNSLVSIITNESQNLLKF
jgi:molybdopterin-binding protein